MNNNNVKYKIIFLRKLVLKKTIYVQDTTPCPLSHHLCYLRNFINSRYFDARQKESD